MYFFLSYSFFALYTVPCSWRSSSIRHHLHLLHQISKTCKARFQFWLVSCFYEEMKVFCF